VDDEVGLAVSRTSVLKAKPAEQVVLQLSIPPGKLDTVPEPEPLFVTVSV
jgi:hypothetical protein